MRLPGAEGCVAGDELAREVESKLQRPVFPLPRDAEVLIEGRVERAGGGYQAELRMLGDDGRLLGSRSLSVAGPDCGELSETLSVVLAVMIDPEAEGQVRAPEPPPAPPKPAPVARTFPDDNRLSTFARVLVNVLPETGFGIGAAYERALGAAGGLRVEVVSFVEQTSHATITGSKDAALDLRLTHAGLAYCPLWWHGERARLAGCAGIELGAIHSQSANLTQVSDETEFWMSGSAALRFSVRMVSALELHLGAAFVATSAHDYWVTVMQPGQPETQQRLAHADAFGAAFDLGLGARF